MSDQIDKVLEQAWKDYKTGQISADHTDKEAFMGAVAIALTALQPEMVEVPTGPGWYWCRVKGLQDRCFRVEEYLGCLRVVDPFTFIPEKPVSRASGCKWYGPLQPPTFDNAREGE